MILMVETGSCVKLTRLMDGREKNDSISSSSPNISIASEMCLLINWETLQY